MGKVLSLFNSKVIRILYKGNTSKELMKEDTSKNSTKKQNLYLPIIEGLKISTNLTKLQKELKISKQKLNYYIRELKKEGIIIQKGRGWYEVVKEVKDLTKYDKILKKDSIRGHGYILEVKFIKIPEDWDKRIEILTKKDIHFKLVGAKLDTPRIKVLGRKIWLCKDHLRIFDKKGNSYYGNNATESRYKALNEITLIISALESKLGVSLDRIDINFKKEHYALIKNDLAIDCNKRGEIIRVSDKFGEFLLIDDSLEEGGELENVGKDAYKTNIPMHKWWIEQKETKFEVTPKFILNTMNGIQQNQSMFAENMESHIKAIKQLGNSAEANTKSIELLAEVIKELKESLRK